MLTMPSGLIDRDTARRAGDVAAELIIDNFAGAGGASLGIEAAMGRCVDVAINHSPKAVKAHSINHPHTRHLCEDVWDVDPARLIAEYAGRRVGLAWFSPDCKHFSKAKGSKPLSKKIRGLAWVVIKWAKAVRPKVIILENVEEFVTWGPLDADGRVIPGKKGQTFLRWVAMLRGLGYEVEHRELVAANYGVPTTRKRFFCIARCDGHPVRWPKRTHAPRNKAAALGKKPWRSAAECIDWSRPCPSIFLSREQAREIKVKRPLADATMRRIARGLVRYVIDADEPFIVTCNHAGSGGLRSAGEPVRTVTGSRDANGVVCRVIAKHYGRLADLPAANRPAAQAGREPQLVHPLSRAGADPRGQEPRLAGDLDGHHAGRAGRVGLRRDRGPGRPDGLPVHREHSTASLALRHGLALSPPPRRGPVLLGAGERQAGAAAADGRLAGPVELQRSDPSGDAMPHGRESKKAAMGGTWHDHGHSIE